MAHLFSNPLSPWTHRVQSLVTAALLLALGGCGDGDAYGDDDAMEQHEPSDDGEEPSDGEDLADGEDGARAAGLTISPAAPNLGLVDTGKSASVTLTITNKLASTETLKSLAVTGAGFSLASKTCGATLGAGKTCTATVKFTPTVAGEKSATLKVTGTMSSAQVVVKGTGSAVTKWHPGHYAYVGDRKVLKDEYVPSAVFRGVQKNYSWSDLEPVKGQYDFSEIDADIQFLKSRGLYLVAQITYKKFKPGTTGVPDYIVNGAAEFGPDRTYVTDNGSIYPSIWVPAVEQRFIELIEALGDQYDKNPAFEMINLPETANGAKLSVLLDAGYTDEKDEVAHKHIMLALRNAFPNTVRVQYMNWSKTLVEHLTAYAMEIGVGVGGPDFNPNRDLPTNEACQSARGVVPLASAVQYADYFKNPPNPASGLMDPHLIYNYGRNELHLNYIFWAKDPDAGFDAAGEMLDEPSFPKNASGGLEAKQPTKLGP